MDTNKRHDTDVDVDWFKPSWQTGPEGDDIIPVEEEWTEADDEARYTWEDEIYGT